MTLAGLRHRLNDLRARAALAWRGLPHGCNPQVDIDRRLTRTPIAVIFDVGANRGQTAAQFRRWYADATIHCFEPVPSTFTILQRNVAGWPRVLVHPIGLGSAAGRVSIGAASDDTRSSIRSAHPGDATSIVIELDTLDGFCARRSIQRIDYLKIDTEGHDLDVLQGGSALLSDGRASIVEVEAGMNADNHFHVGAAALSDYLATHGYRLFGVYEQTLEWPTADAYLRRANLVFVSPETIRRNHWPA